MENKYNKSIIYQITCNDPLITDSYVGSTTNLHLRKINHKTNCNNKSKKNRHYNLNLYKFIRENGGWDNFIFKILEEYNCENKNELLIRERYFIDLLKSSLNVEMPFRTLTEKQKLKKKIDNGDKKKEYKKQKITCDICNSIVCRNHLSRHKKTLKCIKFQKLIEN